MSGSAAVQRAVRELRSRGVDVIDFGHEGDAPRCAKLAAAAMLDSPASAGYGDPRGLPSLRDALATKLIAENGIAADAATQILVTVGAKQAIFTALLALVDRGDEVLIEDPGWVSFEPLVRIAGATPVPLALSPDTGFRFTLDTLHEHITPHTRVLLLCNPHNPTGRCLARDELEAIGAAAVAAGITVIVDEAYEHFVYDGRSHVSMAALPGMAEHTVTVQTVSKIYNMAGWRVGWLVASAALIEQMASIHSHIVGCVAAFAQRGAEAAIRTRVGEGDLPLTEIVARYEAQRDAMVRGLRAIPGVECARPEGAYFAFPSIKSFAMPATRLSERLLEQAGVATTPGSLFGSGGEGHLRLVFKPGIPTIERGMERLAATFGALSTA
jgi:aspartate aminotransferase